MLIPVARELQQQNRGAGARSVLLPIAHATTLAVARPPWIVDQLQPADRRAGRARRRVELSMCSCAGGGSGRRRRLGGPVDHRSADAARAIRAGDRRRHRVLARGDPDLGQRQRRWAQPRETNLRHPATTPSPELLEVLRRGSAGGHPDTVCCSPTMCWITATEAGVRMLGPARGSACHRKTCTWCPSAPTNNPRYACSRRTRTSPSSPPKAMSGCATSPPLLARCAW